MAKKVVRKKKSGEEVHEVVGRVLVGIIACGVLAAESDSEVSDEEKDALVSVVSSFLEGAHVEVSEEEIVQKVGELAQEISDKGAENYLAHLGAMMKDDAQKHLGCLVAAGVTMADGDVTKEESKMYYKIAKALGFNQASADEIWNEAVGEDGEEEESE